MNKIDTRIEHFTDPKRIDEISKLYRKSIPDKDGWIIESLKWEWDANSVVFGMHDHGEHRIPQPSRVIGEAVFKKVKLASGAENEAERIKLLREDRDSWAERAKILAKQSDDLDARNRDLLKRARDAEAAFEELQRSYIRLERALARGQLAR